MRTITLLLITAFLSVSASAAPSNAEEIFELILDKQRERASGMSSYVVAQMTMGKPIVILYEAMHDDDGVFQGYRHVPLPEIIRRLEEEVGLSAQEKRDFAWGYMEGLSRILGGVESETGMPLSGNFMLNMGFFGMGQFLLAGAPSDAEIARQDQAELANFQQSREDLQQFMSSARLVGTVTLNGRSAYHLHTDDVDRVETVDGQTFRQEAASMWIDTEEYVTLKFRVTGTATSSEGPRQMYIEQENSNYQAVGTLYEPHKQVMRMGGVLSKKEQKELEKAKKEMAKFDKEMAKLPKNQQDMMKKMMGPQIEMMKKMVSSGGIEVETLVHLIIQDGGIEEYQDMQRWAAENLGGTAPF